MENEKFTVAVFLSNANIVSSFQFISNRFRFFAAHLISKNRQKYTCLRIHYPDRAYIILYHTYNITKLHKNTPSIICWYFAQQVGLCNNIEPCVIVFGSSLEFVILSQLNGVRNTPRQLYWEGFSYTMLSLWRSSECFTL